MAIEQVKFVHLSNTINSYLCEFIIRKEHTAGVANLTPCTDPFTGYRSERISVENMSIASIKVINVPDHYFSVRMSNSSVY